MKKSLLTALALCMVAGPVFAADQPAPQGAPHEGPMFEKADTDKDGKISKAEWAAKGDAMFNETDTNHDGFISKDEAKSAREAHRAKWEAHKAEMTKHDSK